LTDPPLHPDAQPAAPRPDLDLLPQRAKLLQARASLVEACPFLGFLTLKLPVFLTEDPCLDTACVDTQGRCWFDWQFLASLTLPETRAVLLHETLHLALDVFGRRGPRDPLRWNLAHDHAVNLLIDDLDFDLEPRFLAWPEAAPPMLDRAYTGCPAEAIYELLPPDPPPAFRSDLRYGPADLALGETWRRRVLEALEQSKGRPGNLPGWARRMVGNLIKPQFSWQALLAQRIHGHLAGRRRTFARVGRRGLGEGFVLPGSMKHRGVLGVFVDVSGSISAGELSAFLGELAGILAQTDVHVRVLFWDCQVQEDRLLETSGDLLALNQDGFAGGGGTDPRCLLAWLDEDLNPERPQPSFGVILTDGVCDWPEAGAWPMDTLLVTTHVVPPPDKGYTVLRLDLAQGVPFHG